MTGSKPLLSVTLEIQRYDGRSICGTVVAADGRRLPFDGWLALAAAMSRVCDGAAS